MIHARYLLICTSLFIGAFSESSRATAKPSLKQIESAAGTTAVLATHPQLGQWSLLCEGSVPLLFTENETNNVRLFPGQKNTSPYVKDGINNAVIHGNRDAVNPEKHGTKVAAYYRLSVAAGQSATVRLRLTGQADAGEIVKTSCFGPEFDNTLAARLQDADEFYRSVTPPSTSPDAANVMRQAIAGMLWSKQFYFFDGDTLFLHRTEQALRGQTDVEFLKLAFNKLMLNFTWWVNRKDRFGKNVFEGGFLGLDNIGVFDRSSPLPTGGYLEQADGTAWMALFTQNMLELAVELASHDRVYEDMVVKFAEHFAYIATAMNKVGADGMWDEEDGFYYDVLRLPDGTSTRLKVRSMVGLLPLCATTIIEKWQRDLVPQAAAALKARVRQMPSLLESIHPTGPGHFGVAERGVFALVGPDRLRRILNKMLDENEFLCPHGIRSLSRFHEKNPYVFRTEGQEYRVDYLPGESNTGMFGGNSNWRGPVWMPVNAMIIRALLNFYLYYGDSFKVECPTGSGKMMNLFDVAKNISDRLTGIFLRDAHGRRPVYGGTEKFQTDPHWRDHVLFYEYFQGDNGAGLGASHQTGWTGVVARMIQLLGSIDATTSLASGTRTAFNPR